MKLISIEKTVTFLGILNLIFFMYFLFFGKQGGWFIVDFPYFFGELILFYSPIIFTIISLGVFIFDFYKNKQKNWYCFFMLAIAYLAVVIFVVGSVHRPAH
ncbi:hypothetical protein [Flavobacterium limnophilum]|uniref:hypothetical protein n=1 Tax=Flavobacterium limnophilum TaxID=3003262 RepID=UPI00248219E2|nr:hypothetical protein [Flavobacterium limnophilum]